MKTPEEYINNIEFTNWNNLLEGHRYLHVSKLKELIQEIQKNAYNQAIQDAVSNAKVIEGCEYNKVHKENYFKYILDKKSILKLKIK